MNPLHLHQGVALKLNYKGPLDMKSVDGKNLVKTYTFPCDPRHNLLLGFPNIFNHKEPGILINNGDKTSKGKSIPLYAL